MPPPTGEAAKQFATALATTGYFTVVFALQLLGGALVLLGVYGVTYVGITAAFGIPEARNVIDRGRRLLRLPFRGR